ncbi:hypothetical protein [Psychroserpens sp. NJDZ02]|uniref:hypothetical protein n=1 Tax=Psychroserpens sp. NJDZ02 TaxID=2570561 RepID=UPI0010A83D77|nr:hypothetical protein [Psychroserpens sp. NJDZ02]QCE40385.1 hypothetical protein E9099_02795 [Psychroserpens sp. NJDZ02]
MRSIYLINKFTLIVTLALYLTIFLGFYAQLVLGALQVISALGITSLWNKLSIQNKTHLKIYWFLTLTYGLGWILIDDINSGLLVVLTIVIIPMSIAVYFVTILHSITTKES